MAGRGVLGAGSSLPLSGAGLDLVRRERQGRHQEQEGQEGQEGPLLIRVTAS